MWNWISKLEELRQQGQAVVAVTVTQNTGSTPREPGAKMLVLPHGKFFGTIGGGHFEELAIQEAQTCFKQNLSKTVRYPLGAKTGQCCGGVTELFFEVLNSGPAVYIFGAGHVGQAVCRTLMGTPFLVHSIDEREEWISSVEMPVEVVRHCSYWRSVADEIDWNKENTYVLVMTHRHDTDQEIIEYMMTKPTRFIGLIGSESKWARFQQRLTLKGINEENFKKIKCPVGLKLGGKAPQEIAISIAAELLEKHYGQKSQSISPRRSRSRTRLADESSQGTP